MAQLLRLEAVRFKAKINDDQRHGLPRQFHSSVRVDPAVLGFDQFEVGVGPIAVASDQIRPLVFAICQCYSRGSAFLDFDFFYGGIVANIPAHFFKFANKAVHQSARTAHGKVNAPSFFHKMDHGINGRNRQRVSAH